MMDMVQIIICITITMHKNNFCLNRDLAKAKSWTVQQIKKRTEDLVKDALRLFDLNR